LQEGLEQILQLTLQDQTDEFMKEEISEFDDYGDWIQWVSDAEDTQQAICSVYRITCCIANPSTD